MLHRPYGLDGNTSYPQVIRLQRMSKTPEICRLPLLPEIPDAAKEAVKTTLNDDCRTEVFEPIRSPELKSMLCGMSKLQVRHQLAGIKESCQKRSIFRKSWSQRNNGAPNKQCRPVYSTRVTIQKMNVFCLSPSLGWPVSDFMKHNCRSRYLPLGDAKSDGCSRRNRKQKTSNYLGKLS